MPSKLLHKRLCFHPLSFTSIYYIVHYIYFCLNSSSSAFFLFNGRFCTQFVSNCCLLIFNWIYANQSVSVLQSTLNLNICCAASITLLLLLFNLVEYAHTHTLVSAMYHRLINLLSIPYARCFSSFTVYGMPPQNGRIDLFT